MFNNIMSLLIFVSISVLVYFLKDLPKLFREIKIAEFKGKNEREIQVDSFFRQVKGSEIADVLKFWSEMLLDMDNKVKEIIEDQSKFIEVQLNTLMYGSENTVKILSLTMQHVYSGEQREEEEQSNMLMYYIAYIISSLKKDFTGYSIDPLDIIKTKINDVNTDENKRKFAIANKNVVKALKKVNVKTY